MLRSTLTLLVSLIVLATASQAQSPAASSVAPPSASTTQSDARTVTPDGSLRNDRIQRITTQDRNARVEELRVREQTQHITVTPATGAPYEVIPADTARDAQDARSGAAGRAVWRIFQF